MTKRRMLSGGGRFAAFSQMRKLPSGAKVRPSSTRVTWTRAGTGYTRESDHELRVHRREQPWVPETLPKSHSRALPVVVGGSGEKKTYIEVAVVSQDPRTRWV